MPGTGIFSILKKGKEGRKKEREEGEKTPQKRTKNELLNGVYSLVSFYL